MRMMAEQSTAFIYENIVKPVLFRFPPDDVHSAMLRMASSVGRSNVLTWGVSRVFTTRRSMLAQTVAGVRFRSPVGVSAGFDKNAETVRVMHSLGYGFMTVGSVTAQPCAGNPKPWFHRHPEDKSLSVHVGLANVGSSDVLRRIERNAVHFEGDEFPVILSVAKTNNPETVSTEAAVEDYLTSLRRIKKSSAVQLVELNISCPNTYGGEPFTSPELLEKLLRGVDALELTQPIFVKMPVNMKWEQFDGLLEVIVRHVVAGVTISNLVKDPKLLVHGRAEGVRGGMSGLPTQKVSNDLIAKTYKKYGKKLDIIGVGGVFTAEDAYAKIRRGAKVVALVTGLIYNGPQLGAQVQRGLVKLLRRDGFRSIEEAVGADIHPTLYTSNNE